MARMPRAAAIALALGICASTGLLGQGQEFQFIIAVSDAARRPVTDLGREEILVSDGGVAHEILRIRPYQVPVRLTIAVDNSAASRDALSHYRSGLTGLVKTLPDDLEVTLITTSPQPRMVVRPTTDRRQILRGVNGFAPEDARPRFTDALVEFAQRFEQELKRTGRLDSLPVLVMLSTTANDAMSYEVPAIQRALSFLKGRKARVYIAVLSTAHALEGFAPLNENRQALIGIPAAEITRGRYESLASSSRLATLLPEFGRQIALLHQQHSNQLLVTAERPPELTGPIRSPRIEVTRPGLTGQVSLDGLP